MIYSISGKLIEKNKQFIAIEAGGVGYKIFISLSTFNKLPKIGEKTTVFCSYHVRQEMPEIYGFLDKKELEVFELLNSISGVGPRSAITILGELKIDKFLAAVSQNRADVIAGSSGVGRKRAERIILELKDKIKKIGKEADLSLMDADKDVRSALKNLGYREKDIEDAMKIIPDNIKKVEERVKFVLKAIGK